MRCFDWVDASVGVVVHATNTYDFHPNKSIFTKVMM